MSNEFTLSQLANIKLGLAFKNAIKDAGDMGSFYLIQTKDIALDGGIKYEDLTRVVPEGQADAHVLNTGDIVLRLRGPVFSASIIDKEADLPIITTNQSAVIRCDEEKISPYYLHWYLNSQNGLRYFDSVNEGSNISKISAKVVAAMPLKIPSMEIQRKIGAINKNWLDQKYIHTKLIDNGNQYYSALCNQLQKQQAHSE